MRFLDLRRAAQARRGALERALERVLDSGRFILGGEVEAFEREFAEYLSAPGCVGVASGTDALELALRALGVGPGAEVVCPSLAAQANAAAILRAGAEPVFVDVDPASLTIDPAQVAGAVGPRTAAVVAVHLYGRAAPVGELLALGPTIVEDAAQAHGLVIDARFAGTIAPIGCFSFYPTKNLGALGDAGAVVTSDPELADRLRAARSYGERVRYRSESFGVNSRLDEVQAAFLRVVLGELDEGNRRRAEIAAAYDEVLGTTSHGVHHLYVLRHQQRDLLREALAARGIETLVHYPWPLHLQPAFAGCRRGSELGVSERACREVLSLPCYPELEDAEVETVCSALAEALAEVSRGA